MPFFSSLAVYLFSSTSFALYLRRSGYLDVSFVYFNSDSLLISITTSFFILCFPSMLFFLLFSFLHPPFFLSFAYSFIYSLFFLLFMSILSSPILCLCVFFCAFVFSNFFSITNFIPLSLSIFRFYTKTKFFPVL